MARTPPVRTAGQRPLVAALAGIVLASGLYLQGDLRATQTANQPSGGLGLDIDDGGDSLSARVGPPTGADVDRYIADRTVAMGDLTDVDLAIVSFTELQLPGDLAVLLGGDVTIEAVLLRMPLDTARPVAVRVQGDLVADVQAVIAEAVVGLRADEDDFRTLLASDSLDDPAFEKDARDQADLLAAARTKAESGAPLVHAVVVRGDVAVLRALQQNPAVRLVDPAPPGTDPATSVFHGLLPSDTETVRFGRGA